MINERSRSELSVLDKVRKWIDGDSAELVLEQAARDAQIKPRSRAEEFIVTIAREVESVMQSEIVPLPQGTVIIPTEYVVFLSKEDDAEWRGIKRRGLEQGLYHILAERAREIAGKRKLETRSFAIALKVDATLEKGTVRVQHTWEDAESGKTGVVARPATKPALPAPTPRATAPVVRVAPPAENEMTEVSERRSESDGEEMTKVAPRKSELYKLEVWRGGTRESVIPIYEAEIVVGRGSRSKPVDIPLRGDNEISRRHLTISFTQNGGFKIMNEGRNPAAVAGKELPIGQQIEIAAGTPIAVCSYLLRIVPAG